MKSVKILMMFLLAGSVVFNACKKDEPKAPNITVTGGADQAAPGDDVTYSVLAASEENKLSKVEIKVSINGSSATTDTTATFSSETNKQFDYTYPVATTQRDGDVITLTFNVTDNQGLTGSATRTINVKYAAGEINTYQAKLLGGAGNPNAGSFFDAHTGTVMFTNEADANPGQVDIIYTYSSTNGHLVAAPDDINIAQAHTSVATWSTKNATRFTMTSLTKAQFDGATDDALLVAEANSANQARVNNLDAGNVFAFTTSDGKKGLAHVESVGGATADTRNMVINVKVQK